MDEYMDQAAFLRSMGLTGDETKYGNRDAEHQHRSYSTYMSYEIIDCVDDSIVEEELAPVVHGRWDVEVGMNWFKERICPVCKKHIESNFWNYCPNCGARMDGGKGSD